MSAEKIVEKILEDARAEAQSIAAHAQQQAAHLQAQWEEDAQRQKDSILAQAQEEIERLERQHLAGARLQTKQQELAARRQALDRVFAEVLQRLQHLPQDQLSGFLKDLALQGAQTGTEEVIVAPADRARWSDGFLREINAKLSQQGKQGQLKLSQETRPLEGGLVLQGAGYEINLAFPTLVRQAAEELEMDVARLLFARQEA